MMRNPYRKEATGSSSCGSRGCNSGKENENGGDNKRVVNVVNTSTMGPQSQRRQSSIKSCLKRGTKVKLKSLKSSLKKKSGGLQLGVDGNQSFEAYRDCVVCRGHYLNKMGQHVSISHHAHHVRCSQNRSTRGTSARTVEVNKYAKDMMAHNTMPLSLGQTKGLPSVSQHFQKTTTTTTRIDGSTTTTRIDGSTTTTTKVDEAKNIQEGEH
jgi:hypothetical protein